MYLKKFWQKTFENLKRQTDTQVQGSQSLKQDESKETHHKIYHNSNSKLKNKKRDNFKEREKQSHIMESQKAIN